MSKTHYIPGGEIALLDPKPRKDGNGNFPVSLLIANRFSRIILTADAVYGLLAAIDKNPDLRAFVESGAPK